MFSCNSCIPTDLQLSVWDGLRLLPGGAQEVQGLSVAGASTGLEAWEMPAT